MMQINLNGLDFPNFEFEWERFGSKSPNLTDVYVSLHTSVGTKWKAESRMLFRFMILDINSRSSIR